MRLMDTVVAGAGNDPADWLPELSRRIREMAA